MFKKYETAIYLTVLLVIVLILDLFNPLGWIMFIAVGISLAGHYIHHLRNKNGKSVKK